MYYRRYALGSWLKNGERRADAEKRGSKILCIASGLNDAMDDTYRFGPKTTVRGDVKMKKNSANKVLVLTVACMVLLSFLFTGCKSTEDKWKDALRDYKNAFASFHAVQNNMASNSMKRDWTTDDGRLFLAQGFYRMKYYAPNVEEKLQALEKLTKELKDENKTKEVKGYRAKFDYMKAQTLSAIEPRPVIFGKKGEYYENFVPKQDMNWDKPISNAEILKWAENESKREEYFGKRCIEIMKEQKKKELNDAETKKIQAEAEQKFGKVDIESLLRKQVNAKELKSEAYNTSFGKPASENAPWSENKKAETTSVPDGKGNSAVITGTEVRFRKAPDGQIMGHFEKGETVTVLGKVDNWYKVRRGNGTEGYVSADYCK